MRRVVGAVAVLGMLALSGCGGGDPLPTLPPTPSSTPVFASEEEALAAAEEAYAAYLEMSNLISSQGGIDPERIAPLVTKDRLAIDLEGFEKLRERDLRTTGSSNFEVVELQRFDETELRIEVAFYACWNGAQVRVIDSDGVDITPEDRTSELLLEVVVVGTAGNLVLESDDVWSADSC